MNWYNLANKASFCLSLALACFGCTANTDNSTSNTSLPYYEDASFTPHWLTAGEEALNDFHRIRPFVLVNQLGDTISEKSLEGKVYVADFFFTACPGICPKMTSNMGILQQEFLADKRVHLLSHSVTPRYDSISVLREYAAAKEVDANKWWLLTGDRETIYRLGRKDYFVEEDLGEKKDLDEFLHTENFVLIDQQRHIRGIYNGLNRSSVDQLAADIRTLLAE